MNFSYFIARKLLMGGKGLALSKVIGWISIIGLAAGTFALIISLAVLNGFEERVTNKIIGFEGDLRISSLTEDQDLTKIMNQLMLDKNVKNVLPFQERKGIISNNKSENTLVTLKAIPQEQFLPFYDIKMDKSAEVFDQPIYIGSILAGKLNVNLGDDVFLASPVDHMGFGLPKRHAGKISGIFKAEILDIDERVVFIPLAMGEKIFLRKQNIDGLDVRLNDADKAGELIPYFRRILPGGLSVKSWFDLHSGLFNAMKMERLGTFIVLSLIILVACFNLISTLVLNSYQKIREIGILRTLGTTSKRIQNIILYQGMMIGSVGAIAGIGSGILLIILQNQFGLFPLPEEIYFINKLPMIISFKDLLMVLIVTCLVILISSYLASTRTLSIDPKKAVYLEK